MARPLAEGPELEVSGASRAKQVAATFRKRKRKCPAQALGWAGFPVCPLRHRKRRGARGRPSECEPAGGVAEGGGASWMRASGRPHRLARLSPVAQSSGATPVGRLVFRRPGARDMAACRGVGSWQASQAQDGRRWWQLEPQDLTPLVTAS